MHASNTVVRENARCAKSACSSGTEASPWRSDTLGVDLVCVCVCVCRGGHQPCAAAPESAHAPRLQHDAPRVPPHGGHALAREAQARRHVAGRDCERARREQRRLQLTRARHHPRARLIVLRDLQRRVQRRQSVLVVRGPVRPRASPCGAAALAVPARGHAAAAGHHSLLQQAGRELERPGAGDATVADGPLKPASSGVPAAGATATNSNLMSVKFENGCVVESRPMCARAHSLESLRSGLVTCCGVRV